jgi:hypothetical protein
MLVNRDETKPDDAAPRQVGTVPLLPRTGQFEITNVSVLADVGGFGGLPPYFEARGFPPKISEGRKKGPGSGRATFANECRGRAVV